MSRPLWLFFLLLVSLFSLVPALSVSTASAKCAACYMVETVVTPLKWGYCLNACEDWAYYQTGHHQYQKRIEGRKHASQSQTTSAPAFSVSSPAATLVRTAEARSNTPATLAISQKSLFHPELPNDDPTADIVHVQVKVDEEKSGMNLRGADGHMYFLPLHQQEDGIYTPAGPAVLRDEKGALVSRTSSVSPDSTTVSTVVNESDFSTQARQTSPSGAILEDDDNDAYESLNQMIMHFVLNMLEVRLPALGDAIGTQRLLLPYRYNNFVEALSGFFSGSFSLPSSISSIIWGFATFVVVSAFSKWQRAHLWGKYSKWFARKLHAAMSSLHAQVDRQLVLLRECIRQLDHDKQCLFKLIARLDQTIADARASIAEKTTRTVRLRVTIVHMANAILSLRQEVARLRGILRLQQHFPAVITGLKAQMRRQQSASDETIRELRQQLADEALEKARVVTERDDLVARLAQQSRENDERDRAFKQQARDLAYRKIYESDLRASIAWHEVRVKELIRQNKDLQATADRTVSAEQGKANLLRLMHHSEMDKQFVCRQLNRDREELELSRAARRQTAQENRQLNSTISNAKINKALSEHLHKRRVEEIKVLQKKLEVAQRAPDYSTRATQTVEPEEPLQVSEGTQTVSYATEMATQTDEPAVEPIQSATTSPANVTQTIIPILAAHVPHPAIQSQSTNDSSVQAQLDAEKERSAFWRGKVAGLNEQIIEHIDDLKDLEDEVDQLKLDKKGLKLDKIRLKRDVRRFVGGLAREFSWSERKEGWRSKRSFGKETMTEFEARYLHHKNAGNRIHKSISSRAERKWKRDNRGWDTKNDDGEFDSDDDDDDDDSPRPDPTTISFGGLKVVRDDRSQGSSTSSQDAAGDKSAAPGSSSKAKEDEKTSETVGTIIADADAIKSAAKAPNAQASGAEDTSKTSGNTTKVAEDNGTPANESAAEGNGAKEIGEPPAPISKEEASESTVVEDSKTDGNDDEKAGERSSAKENNATGSRTASHESIVAVDGRDHPREALDDTTPSSNREEPFHDDSKGVPTPSTEESVQPIDVSKVFENPVPPPSEVKPSTINASSPAESPKKKDNHALPKPTVSPQTGKDFDPSRFSSGLFSFAPPKSEVPATPVQPPKTAPPSIVVPPPPTPAFPSTGTSFNPSSFTMQSFSFGPKPSASATTNAATRPSQNQAQSPSLAPAAVSQQPQLPAPQGQLYQQVQSSTFSGLRLEDNRGGSRRRIEPADSTLAASHKPKAAGPPVSAPPQTSSASTDTPMSGTGIPQAQPFSFSMPSNSNAPLPGLSASKYSSANTPLPGLSASKFSSADTPLPGLSASKFSSADTPLPGLSALKFSSANTPLPGLSASKFSSANLSSGLNGGGAQGSSATQQPQAAPPAQNSAPTSMPQSSEHVDVEMREDAQPAQQLQPPAPPAQPVNQTSMPQAHLYNNADMPDAPAPPPQPQPAGLPQPPLSIAPPTVLTEVEMPDAPVPAQVPAPTTSTSASNPMPPASLGSGVSPIAPLNPSLLAANSMLAANLFSGPPGVAPLLPSPLTSNATPSANLFSGIPVITPPVPSPLPSSSMPSANLFSGIPGITPLVPSSPPSNTARQLTTSLVSGAASNGVNSSGNGPAAAPAIAAQRKVLLPQKPVPRPVVPKLPLPATSAPQQAPPTGLQFFAPVSQNTGSANGTANTPSGRRQIRLSDKHDTSQNKAAIRGKLQYLQGLGQAAIGSNNLAHNKEILSGQLRALEDLIGPYTIKFAKEINLLKILDHFQVNGGIYGAEIADQAGAMLLRYRKLVKIGY